MPTAVVTGCTGFVGAELCKQLLSRGFNVKGTVRSANASRSKELLSALSTPQLGGSMQLVEADLLVPGSFDSALQDAEYLFHVASPFAIVVDDPQRQLVDTAVMGTRNVLTSAAKNKATIRRVVVTSSVAAVHDCHQKQVPKRPDGKWSEEDFNETSTLEGNPPEGYWVSKVQAEKEAWAQAKEHGLDLVTILPEFVMGPVLTASAAATSLSASFFKGFLEAPGGEVPSGTWMFADVRDVALAHILAVTLPTASGRYIVSQPTSLCSRHVTDILKANIPGLAIPDGKEEEVKSNIDNTKASKELGLKITPVAETLTDMAKSLTALGFATPKYS